MTPMAGVIEDLAGDFLSRHPGEAARTLQSLDADDSAHLLGNVPVPRAALALTAMGADVATLVIRRAPQEVQWRWLAAMDPSDAAAVIQRLGEELDRPALLSSLPVATRRDLETFLSYPDSTAGSLMDAATPIFRADARAGDVEAAIRDSGRTDDQAILVVDAERRLLGAIETIRVLLADPDARLQQLALRQTPTVDAFAHRDEVAEMLEAHPLSVLPVVDIDGRPVGAIRQAELASVAEEEASADIQSMVGASREERALSPVSFAVRKRLPWLQINLATAFLAASVVGLFEETIAQFTALAVLLPVVAGQSGNTGAQALAVTMRGLALREISLRQWARVVSKESFVGLLNGVAVAVVTMAGVYLWSGSLGLCMVIGAAMVISMAIAGVAGAAVPLVLSALGQDPAQSSSIVLTTVTDIMGFFSFLGLATLFASLL